MPDLTERLELHLSVNGKPLTLQVDPNLLLVDLLREQLGLLGTKVGCDQGACGACTVLIDGRPVTSCLTFAFAAEGGAVTTIEGIAHSDGSLDAIQRAFHEAGAPQCGFCTPGMVLMAKAYTLRRCGPDTAEAWLQANLCRCSGYQAIRRALDAAGLGVTTAGDKP
jgi:carbon-monoxide dehydrogenase small subunit